MSSEAVHESGSTAARAFHLTVEQDGLAILVFDTPRERANIYSSAAMGELELLLDDLAKRSDVKALLWLSAKPDIFIAGANLDEIATADGAFGRQAVKKGQAIFNKLANLPFPTVAAIHGACVGGGCETVLCMDWRLASDGKKTQIGLPETKLGIIPGWGGTSRLPRVIGLANALDIILAGKTLDAKRAKRMGLVDEVVPQAVLVSEAKKFARAKFGSRKRANQGRGGGPLRARKPTVMERILEGPGKAIVFSKARATVMKQTGGNYPAQLEALSAVQKGFGRSLTRALELEVEASGRLIGSPVMRHLVNLYYQMEAVKKETGAGASAKPREVARVGILGAGVMGGGIAQLAADRGYPCRMKDIKNEQLAGGYAAAAKIWNDKLKKRRLTRAEFAAKMALLSGTLDYRGFEQCDFVIEAVLEKMAVKHAVLKEWEAVASASAIFASNTSTLPIGEIASVALHPERVAGMHFFNPVHRMPLVEVIYGEKTDPEVTATVFAFAKKLGKTPVVVKDAPGFLVNRILAPYLGEAMQLLLAGVPIEAIDKTMRKFGMPVGPVELLDDVGVDVAAKAAETLSATWPDRMPQDPAFGKLVGTGRLGRKVKKGFYLYERDSRRGPDPEAYSALGVGRPGASPIAAEQIVERLVYPMINEGALCLADGIVPDASKLDLAMIFGTGFPPFRGGLMAYADSLGLDKVVATLDKLAERDPKFAPAANLRDLANQAGRFHLAR